MKYSLYMFDFDLTMADSATASALIYSAAYEAVGLKFDKGEVFRHLGMPLESTYEEISPLLGGKDLYLPFKSAFNRTIEQVFDMVKPYSDVYENFKRIVDDGAKVAIVTTRRHNAMDKFVALYPEISELLSAMITSDEVVNRKPAPEPILKCLEKTGVPNSRAVYLGDAINDKLAALAAGTDFIRVNRTGLVPDPTAIKTFDEIQ